MPASPAEGSERQEDRHAVQHVRAFRDARGLKTAGLTASDVTLVNVKADSILATWQRKDIDGAYIWHPVLGDLLADNGKLLLKTGDLAASGTLVFDGIVVRNEFKEKRPELVLAYLKEYDRLCTMYEKQPEEVVKVLSPYLADDARKNDGVHQHVPFDFAEGACDRQMDGAAGCEEHGRDAHVAVPGRIPEVR